MGPEADEALDGERLQRPDGLDDAAHPARHLARRVDVVRLHVLRETLLRKTRVPWPCVSPSCPKSNNWSRTTGTKAEYLGEEVELDHGVGERVGEGAQRRHEAQHGAVEGAVDLLERRLARVVDVDDGHVAQEAVRQRLAARIGRRVARAHELDAFQPHPRLLALARRPPEAALQHQTRAKTSSHSFLALLLDSWLCRRFHSMTCS